MFCGCSLAVVCLDHPYDIFACDSFSRNGLRPYTSPAEEVIRDFVSRGISVDQLYCMLAGMDAWGCMALLEDYGEESLGDMALASLTFLTFLPPPQ